jgi:putative flippase GtrA
MTPASRRRARSPAQASTKASANTSTNRPAGRAATGLRYVGVGAVATLAHYALLWLAVEQGHWPAPLAAGAGAVLGAQVGFVGNRWFTFGHRGAVWPAWWRFQLTALLSALTSMAVVAVGGAWGLHYLLAQALATALALALGFSINRRWAFA